jgi:transposase
MSIVTSSYTVSYYTILTRNSREPRFWVAKSFVQKIIRQWRETGDLNPRIPSGGQKLKLSQSQLIILGDWVNEKNDITLEKIQQRLEEEEKVKVSLSTICRLLQSLNLSRKKNTPWQRT